MRHALDMIAKREPGRERFLSRLVADAAHAERWAIWQRLVRAAKWAYRRNPIGLVLAVADGPRELVRKGPDPIIVTGDRD